MDVAVTDLVEVSAVAKDAVEDPAASDVDATVAEGVKDGWRDEAGNCENASEVEAKENVEKESETTPVDEDNEADVVTVPPNVDVSGACELSMSVEEENDASLVSEPVLEDVSVEFVEDADTDACKDDSALVGNIVEFDPVATGGNVVNWEGNVNVEVVDVEFADELCENVLTSADVDTDVIVSAASVVVAPKSPGVKENEMNAGVDAVSTGALELGLTNAVEGPVGDDAVDRT